MHTVRLQSLVSRFWVESESVFNRFSYVFPTGHETCSQFHLWCQEMCVIRLLDAWARFCRELVLFSATEKPLTAGGTRLPLAPGIATRKDALQKLQSVYSKLPYEPRWHDAQACLNGASLLGVANYPNISAGIGVTPSPLEDLRHLRNFVAHRNDRTAARVRVAATNILVAPTSDVIAILQSPSKSPPATVLQLWIRQLQAMSQIAVR